MGQKQFKKARKLLREANPPVPVREYAELVNTKTYAKMKVNHPQSKRGMYLRLKKQLRNS